jgi:hypothetical protein
MTPLRSLALPVALLVLGLVACDKPDPDASRPPPPPPVASAKPGACAGGGGVVADPVSAGFFPRVVDAYCLDPQGDVRTYGEQGKLDMDAVCTTAFDGECAIYNQFGLKRLVSLRYIDGAGGAGTVDVYLSRFADAAGAYAMFTKRVVADSDPAEPSTPKPLAAGAAGAIGTGRAYVWKDKYLAELQYNNEQETPEALAVSSARVLSAVATRIGAKLPGTAELPSAVEALPTEHRISNGTQLVPKDALGIPGFGPVAVGYYADGAARYRLVAFVGSDEAKAKDAWKILRGRPGALPIAGAFDEGVAITLAPQPGQAPDAPPREYVLARRGTLIVGAGNEDLVTGPASRLDKSQKIAKLAAWLAGPKAKP